MASESDLESVGFSDVEAGDLVNDSEEQEDALARDEDEEGDDFLFKATQTRPKTMAARMSLSKTEKARAAAEEAKRREQQQHTMNARRRKAVEEAATERRLQAAERRVQEEIRMKAVAANERHSSMVKKKKKAAAAKKGGTPTRTRPTVFSDEEDEEMDPAHKDDGKEDAGQSDLDSDTPLINTEPLTAAKKRAQEKKLRREAKLRKLREQEESEDDEEEVAMKPRDEAGKKADADEMLDQSPPRPVKKSKARRGHLPKEKPVLESPTRSATRKRKLMEAEPQGVADRGAAKAAAAGPSTGIDENEDEGIVSRAKPTTSKRAAAKGRAKKAQVVPEQTDPGKVTASNTKRAQPRKSTIQKKDEDSIDEEPVSKTPALTSRKASDEKDRGNSTEVKAPGTGQTSPKDARSKEAQSKSAKASAKAARAATTASNSDGPTVTPQEPSNERATKRQKLAPPKTSAPVKSTVPTKLVTPSTPVSMRPGVQTTPTGVRAAGSTPSGVARPVSAGGRGLAVQQKVAHSANMKPAPTGVTGVTTARVHQQRAPGSQVMVPVQRSRAPVTPVVAVSEDDQAELGVTMLEMLQREYVDFAAVQERTIRGYLESLRRRPSPTATRSGAMSSLWQTSEERGNLRRQKLCGFVDSARLELRSAQEEALVQFAQKISQGLRVTQDTEVTTLGDILKKEHRITSQQRRNSAPVAVRPKPAGQAPPQRRGAGSRFLVETASTQTATTPSRPATQQLRHASGAEPSSPVAVGPPKAAQVTVASPRPPVSKATAPVVVAASNQNGVKPVGKAASTGNSKSAVAKTNTIPDRESSDEMDVDNKVAPQQQQPPPQKFRTIGELKKFVGDQYTALNLGCIRSVAVLLLCDRPGGLRLETLIDVIPSAKKTLIQRIEVLRKGNYIAETQLVDSSGNPYKVYTTVSKAIASKR